MDRRGFLTRATPAVLAVVPAFGGGALAALLRPRPKPPTPVKDGDPLTAEVWNDLVRRVHELEHH